MRGFRAGEHVSKYYGGNPAFAAILSQVPGFDYQAWAELPLAEALARLDANERERAEDALSGWEWRDRALTPRQEQFVASHSGENRIPSVRGALAEVGPEAMSLVAGGDVAGARKVLRETGLSPKVIAVFLTGWEHDFMEHELDEHPAVCVVVNAVSHKTYVGRIVKIDDDVLWQEVEPGQIVEHRRSDLGEIPAVVMADPFYRQKDMGADALRSPWLNSWCITYDAEGRPSVKTAQLVLFNAYSVKPNPFKGRIVSDTGRRFIQETGEAVYSGHLKSMTGELEIGRAYELTYHGPMGKQTIEVKALEVEAEKPAAPSVREAAAGCSVEQEVLASFVPSVQDGREWWKGGVAKEVVAICADIYKRLEVVVPPQDVVACVQRARSTESFSGRVLEVDPKRGMVVQSLGRRRATVHRLDDFETVPEKGANLDIKYCEGQLAVVKNMGLSKSVAR